MSGINPPDKNSSGDGQKIFKKTLDMPYNAVYNIIEDNTTASRPGQGRIKKYLPGGACRGKETK